MSKTCDRVSRQSRRLSSYETLDLLTIVYTKLYWLAGIRNAVRWLRLGRGNRKKCQRHGVSIAEIESLFERTVLIGPDAEHSEREQRFRAIGVSEIGRSVFLIFTWRTKVGQSYLRAISARYMHKKEVAKHGKKIP
jgi:uncharacterized protein